MPADPTPEGDCPPPCPTRSEASLFVVATPIGNLSDITLRAIQTLKSADFVVAEDTRRSRALLSHLGITGKPVRCIDAHASASHIAAVVAELTAGKSAALLTDAGTPSVSDPGTALVRACVSAQLKVVPIPGASAVTTAIAGSALVEQGFWFVGFLPRKGTKRKALLDRIEAFPDAVVLFEAPPRMQQTLDDLAARQPTRTLCVARELTKKFEEFRTAALQDWSTEARAFRGELTLVLGPMSESELSARPNPESCEELARELLSKGLSAKDVAAEVSLLSGLSKREAYQLALRLRQ